MSVEKKTQPLRDYRVLKCPVCQSEVSWAESKFRPFCSERCKLIDFGHWANEEHRIPVSGQDETFD